MATKQMSKTSEKRRRRKFTAEFKAEVVQMCRDSGKSPEAVAKDLGLTGSAVRNWVEQATVDARGGGAGPLTSAERAELQQLRRENKQLRQERDILKKATSFFVKECTT